ncbi:MAG: hypothetical protein ACLUZZ_02905 [Alistipes inops]
MNEEAPIVINLLISMIPIAVVGFFFRDAIEGLFTSIWCWWASCCSSQRAC